MVNINKLKPGAILLVVGAVIALTIAPVMGR